MRTFARTIVGLALAGCTFAPTGGARDVDARDVGSGCVTTCGEHAACVGDACVCDDGWFGDGATCVDIDECAEDNGGCAARCVDLDGSFACYAPASCDELHDREPGLVDGEYTLYAGDAPWRARCVDLATAPATYLKLPDGNVNLSQYTGGTAPSDEFVAVRTSFAAVRIDPTRLWLDTRDLRFATSTGTVMHNQTVVTSMPYGVAMDCGENWDSATGVAELDLTGTPFAVADPTLGGSFLNGGNSTGGSVTAAPASGGQRVSITGGGRCGWIAPAQVQLSNPSFGAPYNPPQDRPFTRILALRLR